MAVARATARASPAPPAAVAPSPSATGRQGLDAIQRLRARASARAAPAAWRPPNGRSRWVSTIVSPASPSSRSSRSGVDAQHALLRVCDRRAGAGSCGRGLRGNRPPALPAETIGIRAGAGTGSVPSSSALRRATQASISASPSRSGQSGRRRRVADPLQQIGALQQGVDVGRRQQQAALLRGDRGSLPSRGPRARRRPARRCAPRP